MIIAHQMLDEHFCHNDSHSKQIKLEMTNDRYSHNYHLWCNRNRNKMHILLLFIAIFMCKCCTVTGDSTGKCPLNLFCNLYITVNWYQQFFRVKLQILFTYVDPFTKSFFGEEFNSKRKECMRKKCMRNTCDSQQQFSTRPLFNRI